MNSTFRFLGFVFLSTILGAALPGQVPRIDVDKPGWDFGDREQGDKDQLFIEVSNLGDAKLEISKVGVTCGCVKARVEQQHLAPGQTTTLILDLDTTRQSGEIRKHVYIESNDPKTPKLMLPVQGKIQPLWWVGTRSLNFGSIEEGSQPEQSFKIHVLPGREVKLRRIRQNAPGISFHHAVFGTVEGAHGWDVHVKVEGTHPIGRLGVALTIEMQSAMKAIGTVTIIGEVLGPIIVKPRGLRFGGIKRGASKTIVISVKNRDEKTPLSIEKISCLDPQISSRVVEKIEGRLFEIHITCTPKGKNRRVAGRLYIKTNHPRQKLFPVYYQAGVLPEDS